MNVTYTYDDATVAYSKGRLTKAQYPTDQTEFKYDSIGREIQSIKKINSVSFDVQRNYDDLNRLVSLQYPNQRNVKYTYNAAGQISGASLSGSIKYDTANSVTTSGSSGLVPITVSASGSNRMLVVSVTLRAVAITAPTITSLNSNTTLPLTRIARSVRNLGTRQVVTELWYLQNPPAGLNTISATFSGSASGTMAAMSLSNVKQVAPEASNIANATSNAPSVAVTPLTSNAWVVNAVGVDNTPTVTVGAGQTQFFNKKNSIFHVGAGSYKAVATPVSTTMNWTLSASQGWATVSAVFAPTADTALVTNVEYNAMGQVTKVTYGNGTVTTNTYNPVSFRLARINTVNGATVLQDLNYTYDPAGDILTITDNSPGGTATQSFQYDELNRLTYANNANYGTKNYSYDAIGNIVSKDGKTYTYMQNGAGPHAVTLLSDGTNFQYDLNGNMITKVEAGNTFQYSYDVENRLINVKKNGVNLADYSYDGDGGRVKKTVYSPSTVTTTYVGSLYEETAGTGINFIYLGDARIASIDTTGRLLYYLSDHLGGSNIITDSTGVKKELTEYDPYGQYSRHDKYGTSQEVAMFYFTGKKLDDETGLYYYGARYYDPKLGRFITPDTIVQNPSNSQTFNRYAYCGNNPVNYIDPSGHWFWAAIIAIVKLAAAHPFITGAIVGAVQGGVSAGINGGNILQGIITGGLAGWAGAGIGVGVGNAVFSGLIGKGVGQFWAGWASSAIGAAAGGFTGGLTQAVTNGASLNEAVSAGFQSAGYAAGFAGVTYPVGYAVAKATEVKATKVRENSGTEKPIGASQNNPQKSLDVDGGAQASNKQALSNGNQPINDLPKSNIAVRSVGDVEPIQPLENITYTEKVILQRQNFPNDIRHSFPDAVDSFAVHGIKTVSTGVDGRTYTKIEIYGSYKGQNGNFEYYIRNDDLTVNHRYFNPDKK